ncbi:hypothetical protein ACHAQA_005782 [Verticillium albo-atrum]
MRSSVLTSLGAVALVLHKAKADFGVWYLQEDVVGSGSFNYPLLTSTNVEEAYDVYTWWENHAHWYELECDGCGYGDSIYQTGGKYYVGESSRDEGYRLLFESIEDGPNKDACSQLMGITCDYRVIRDDGAEVGGCEYGGKALSFIGHGDWGVFQHVGGFRHLYCVSQQVSFE